MNNVIALRPSRSGSMAPAHKHAFDAARAEMIAHFRLWVQHEHPSAEDVRLEIDGTAGQLDGIATLESDHE